MLVYPLFVRNTFLLNCQFCFYIIVKQQIDSKVEFSPYFLVNEDIIERGENSLLQYQDVSLRFRIENCLTMSISTSYRRKYIRSHRCQRCWKKSTFKILAEILNQQLVIFLLASMNVCLFCVKITWLRRRVSSMLSIVGNESSTTLWKKKMLSTWKKIFWWRRRPCSYELEGEFAELGGWEAERPSYLLQNLGISEDLAIKLWASSQWGIK